ncbi:RNA polymerase sigma factor [Halodesulfovibrio marinisediminis]|uniref:Sigma-70 region 2 n=1 Tax=Halodesulfovibrio marinisediminis DSM 17456 TaxID=1121457 RepID=A0A1N6DSA0_9BACT|nr:sigma-70 family RNA polymerase sigma factor [Halodesulfovibrio marinisediminis]SIN73662.1 Sigma-70 region 2 [Halodesulfovibrio marinisediminis DSM 17456]
MEPTIITERSIVSTQCPASTKTNSNDEHLVALCLEGNQAAWNRFVSEFSAIIRHAVSWTLNHHGANADAADDIVQDIFFRLIKSEYRLLENWDSSRGTLKTWLAVVSRSAAIDFVRTDRTYLYDAIEEHEDLKAEMTNFLDLPELPLDVLSTRQKSVLQCLYGEDLSAVEAAKQLDIHPQTVRSIHHTALQKLRAAIIN